MFLWNATSNRDYCCPHVLVVTDQIFLQTFVVLGTICCASHFRVDSVLYFAMTMNTIRVRSKPVLIILGISAFIILWVAFRTFRGLPMEQRVLRTEKQQFLLEGEPFRILSGAIHYFRVVPEYWKDRLLKLKAMGLNTVET